MFFTYILFSEKDKRLYIGFTDNLRGRISKHKHGFVRSTKHRLPLRLIYYESYLFKKDAKQREKYLKGGKGRSELKIQLKETFQKVGYIYR